jgi:hypothetical protein
MSKDVLSKLIKHEDTLVTVKNYRSFKCPNMLVVMFNISDQ